VVSSSPELIQIFFRLRLKIYLLLLVNKRLKVRLEDEIMYGDLMDLNEETITLSVGNKKRIIPLDTICFFVVLDKKVQKTTIAD
jgi:hypothetical protein